MNRRDNRVPAEFGAETRFDVGIAPPAPFKGGETALEALKNELLDERLAAAPEPGLARYLSHAASEAAALAWVTPYPLLVFPVLFEEKSEAALARFARQAQIRQHSQEFLLV